MTSGTRGANAEERGRRGSSPSPSQTAARPMSIPRPDRDGDDEMEPDDFDLLVSRSLSFSCGPVLEPEPMENTMLRNRRVSITSHPGRSSPPIHSPRDASPAPADETTSLLLLPSKAQEAAPFLNGISRSRFWLIFNSILATYFIACFDGTIMASSHPVITSHFHSSNSASWLSTAFLLASTAFQPLLGRLSDTVGRKKPYVCTMAVFMVATLWCALAGSMLSFILARAMCGLGAGGMMTLGSIIVSDLVPIEVRGSYQSWLNVAYGVGSALGAALGGAMADHLGWRWEFGVQVPVLVVCVGVAVIAVPDDLGLAGKRESVLEALKAFDFRGSFLLTTSIVFLVLGLNLGGNILPWSHPFVISALVTFAVCFPAFLYVQSYALRPIMPLYLVRRSPRANLIFANMIAAFLVNAILFNIPLFFQGVLLSSATSSGLRLVIPSIVSSAAGTATGFLITYTRGLKWAPMYGTSLFLVGTVVLCLLRRGWPPFLYLLCLVPSSIGQGFQFPGTVMAILAVSEQREQAVVTSTLILWRSLGMICGIAASSLAMQNALLHYLSRNVQGAEREEVIRMVRGSVEAIGKLGEPYRGQVIDSYEAALRVVFVGCSVLAFVAVCLIAPIKLPRLGHRK